MDTIAVAIDALPYTTSRGMLQRDLLQDLKSRTLASEGRITALVRPLDPERLLRPPPAGGWSVGQILEHLCISDAIYDGPARVTMAKARPDAAAPLREWRPTLFGRLLAWAFSQPRKLPTLKAFEPGPTPRGGVLEAFWSTEHHFHALLDAAASLDWRRIRMGDPAVGPYPKMNLGDVFVVHVVHVERHLTQIERALAALR